MSADAPPAPRPPPGRLVVDRLCPGLSAELWRMVGEARGGDALAPVTVVAPTPYAGLHLRESLGESGFANVRFIFMPVLAEMLGGSAPGLRGRRPLTRVVEGALLRRVLDGARGELRRVAGHTATLASLRSSFGELRVAEDGVREAHERGGGLGAEVSELYRLFRAEVEEGWYDTDDLARAAAGAVETDGAIRWGNLGPIILYLPRRLSPGQVGLASALARSGRCSAILGLTGDAAADAETEALAAELARYLGPPRPARERSGGKGVLPGRVRLHTAPSAHDEVRWVIRRMAERAERERTPLRRMAILYRAAEPYAALVPDELRLAGIPMSGPDRTTLAETPAGRLLIGALELASGEMGRAQVMEWLTGCPVGPPGGDPRDDFRPSRWDSLTREAGIVGGLGQWQERLRRHADRLSSEADRGELDGSIGGARAAGMRARAEAAEAAGRFVTHLARDLTPPPAPATWTEHRDWAARLLDLYLLEDLPEEEAASVERIAGALDDIAAVDDIAGPTGLEEFRRAVEDALRVPAGRLGRLGQGVFVSALSAAAGMEFDEVWMVGMIEGRTPPPVRPDPLLPESAARLRTEKASAAERFDYLSAAACAPARTLSYPAADGSSDVRAYPSRWFLEQASRLEGRQVHTSDLGGLAGAAWMTVDRSSAEAIGRAGEEEGFADAHDHDLGRLLEWTAGGRRPSGHPLARRGALARAVAMARARSGAGLTEFDGNLAAAAPDARFARALGSAPVSPTSLETWARCPFRYFLGYVLRLGAVEAPEEITTITALERGSLVHRILERFMAEATGEGWLPAPQQPWGAGARERIMEVAGEEFRDAEERGITGRPLLWELEREQIASDLHTFLEEDSALRRRHGTAAVRVEQRFGLQDTPQAALDLGDGTSVPFRGSADRMDVSEDGARALVIDYKTGSPGPYASLNDDVIDRGRRLQLGVYSLAARAVAPGAGRIEAAYWFVTNRGGFRFAPARLADMGDEASMDRLREGIGTIVRGIRSGAFPANPGPRSWRGAGENCTFCDFDSLCPSRRVEAWERKKSHPVLAGYLRLSEASGEEA